jgi:hypothetical protein
VTALPAMPCATASASAPRSAARGFPRGISSPSGIGLATSCPPGSPSAARIRWARGDLGGAVHAQGRGQPGVARPEGGKGVLPVGDDRHAQVSSTSSVFGRSRIALAPAATTVTGVRASSCRSAEMSKLCFGPAMHAADPAGGEDRDAGHMRAIIVAATVVAPVPPAGQAGGQIGAAELHAATPVPARRARRRRARRGAPAITAMVAGTAPAARTSASTARAVSTFCGQGMPWVMIVDSSATTGAPEASASATSGDKA